MIFYSVGLEMRDLTLKLIREVFTEVKCEGCFSLDFLAPEVVVQPLVSPPSPPIKSVDFKHFRIGFTF